MIKSTSRAALMAYVLLTPIAAEAQHYRRDGRDHIRDRHGRRGPEYRNWRRGERFDARYARNYGVLDHRRYRGLRAPPRGYRYVRSGNDAVLVGITTGIVAAVIANAIR